MMKNLIYFSILIFITATGLVFIQSCKKDTDNFGEGITQNDKVILRYSSELTVVNEDSVECEDGAIAGVSFSDSVLVFDDYVHFEIVVKCLENEMKSHDAILETAFNRYTFPDTFTYDEIEEVVDAYLDSIGYVEWEPLLDFEKEFEGFESRRAYVESAIQSWLDTDTSRIDWDDDPDEWDIFFEEERALLNENGYVKIGDTIVNLVEMYDEEIESGLCHVYRKDKVKPQYASSPARRVKHVFVTTVFPYFAPVAIRIKGKAVHYIKKKSIFGKWRRSKAWMKLDNNGVYCLWDCEGFCDGVLSAFTDVTYTKKLKATNTVWSVIPYKFLDDSNYSWLDVYDEDASNIIYNHTHFH